MEKRKCRIVLSACIAAVLLAVIVGICLGNSRKDAGQAGETTDEEGVLSPEGSVSDGDLALQAADRTDESDKGEKNDKDKAEISAAPPTMEPEMHQTEKPAGTSEPKPAATAAPKPVTTQTPKPAATAASKPVTTQTPKPAATAAPKPVTTQTPKPAATQTPKPQSTATSTPVQTDAPTRAPLQSDLPADKPTAAPQHVHVWEEGWFQPPDCTYGGDGHHRICKVCGLIENIPDGTGALGHVSDGGTVLVPPTCSQPGIRGYHCVRCGQRLADEEIAPDMTAHDWWTDSEGLTYCTECGVLRVR